MADVHERLQHTNTLLPPPEDPFERLLRRRDRRRRRERALAGAVAAILVIGVLGGTLAVLSRTGSREIRNPAGHGSAGGSTITSGRGTAGRLALGDGQYLYVRWTTTMPGWSYTQQSWWATDDSGRTTFECSQDP